MSATDSSSSRPSHGQSFEQLLAAARAGCRQARGQLLDGCRRYLLLEATRALESSLRPKEGASDLVQSTYVIAQDHFDSFRGTSLGELLAWLHRILDRQLATQVRRYKYTHKRALRREVPLDDAQLADNLSLVDRQAGPAEAAALADDRDRVRRALARLAPDDRQVLTLRAWQRLPFAEIGRQLGRSTGAVEKLWLRALERLHEELKVET